ncbi:CopG family transcriptional regulator [Glycomyces tenuis]|uniref:ribbon-helix-helix domain-containing protein n=1 Tax=Glycomyces tenuis TaxID=58116 RepID=UPI00041FCA9A|nr:CopG family transcriptional regulator [Glycomyces tenuis]
MLKTTVYLPEDLKDALRRSAAQRGVAEAELIRELLAAGLASEAPQWDKLPTIHSPELAALDDDEEFLRSSGFGE